MNHAQSPAVSQLASQITHIMHQKPSIPPLCHCHAISGSPCHALRADEHALDRHRVETARRASCVRVHTHTRRGLPSKACEVDGVG